jgi:hypothetical protein
MQTIMHAIMLVQTMMQVTILVEMMIQAIGDGGVRDKWFLIFSFIIMHQVGFPPSHNSWYLLMYMWLSHKSNMNTLILLCSWGKMHCHR